VHVLLHLLAEAFRARHVLLDAVLHDCLLRRAERRVEREPFVADRDPLRASLVGCGVGCGGDRGEIGLGLRELGIERRLDLVVQRTSAVARGLAVRDRGVELLLLHRVERELVLGARDHVGDHAVGRPTRAVAMRTMRLRQRHPGAKRRRDRDGGNSGNRAEPAGNVISYPFGEWRHSDSAAPEAFDCIVGARSGFDAAFCNRALQMGAGVTILYIFTPARPQLPLTSPDGSQS
jgi:hypothetical protein